MRETTKLFFALALAAVGACKAAPPPPKPDAVAGVPAAQLPVADAPYGVVAKPKPPPPPLQVLETQPKAGERIGPDQAKLSLQFSGPIDEDAVGAALHLSPSVHGLAGGTLTISVNAIGTARKLIDQFVIPATAGLGASLGQTFVNGRLMLQIQLSEAVTSSDIQSFLQRITFATKGKGLKTLTRTMDVTLTNVSGVIGVIQQTINVRKKA